MWKAWSINFRMTVIITVEYYLHVAFPTRSKLWCNEANASKCSVTIVVAAILLHLIYPLNRIIQRLECPDGRRFYQVRMRPGNNIFHYPSITVDKCVSLIQRRESRNNSSLGRGRRGLFHVHLINFWILPQICIFAFKDFIF